MGKTKSPDIRRSTTPAAKSEWARSYGTLIAGQAHVDALDALARDMERTWGVDRLPTLVDADLAGRFHVQRYKTNRAIWEAGDVPALQAECARMTNAWRALDRAARAAGAKPLADLTPSVWEAGLSDGSLLVIAQSTDDASAWVALARGGRRAQVWTLDEVVHMIDGAHFVQQVKRVFDGASVVAAKRRTDPLGGIMADQPLDDPIPF